MAALFLLPFSALFFVWILTFVNMMHFRHLYTRARARERRYAEMVEQLTGVHHEQTARGQKPCQ